MDSGSTVRDFMATDLFLLPPDLEINRAMRALLDQHLSGAPVVDASGKLVGVLSKKDCLRAAFAAHYHQLWGGVVSDYMSEHVETLPPDLDIVRAASVFIEGSYRRFPVVEHGNLVGQISRCDLLEGLSRHWS